MSFTEDCTTRDLERLQAEINSLALGMQELQKRATVNLDIRDQCIVAFTAIELYHRASRRATGKIMGFRFLRTIRESFTIARFFTKSLSGGEH